MASDDWGSDHKIKRVNDPLPGSYEEMLSLIGKRAKLSDFVLPIATNTNVVQSLDEGGVRLQRAVSNSG